MLNLKNNPEIIQKAKNVKKTTFNEQQRNNASTREYNKKQTTNLS
jgi:hypothetical protein